VASGVSRQELIWDGLKLRLGSKPGRILAAVERDTNWPKMWRVHHGGRVSDITNLTRAKDAAILIALSELDGGCEMRRLNGLPLGRAVAT